MTSANLGSAMLILDLKGAFNAVKTAPLITAMKRFGVPDCPRRWIAAFMSERAIRSRRRGVYGDVIRISQGLPQGSPLSPLPSPILFAILLADIGTKWPKTVKIYTDGIQIMARGASPGDTRR